MLRSMSATCRRTLWIVALRAMDALSPAKAKLQRRVPAQNQRAPAHVELDRDGEAHARALQRHVRARHLRDVGRGLGAAEVGAARPASLARVVQRREALDALELLVRQPGSESVGHAPGGPLFSRARPATALLRQRP